ncbi:hypothetical protein HZC30_04300 [Candidatus Woesearchaeota archaeon]|nr:hypothetical protein [Candidatus Woesearchaeota archaeon]
MTLENDLTLAEGTKLDLESIPEFIRPYIQAKREGTLRRYYLDRFRHQRDDYLDDLPEADVRVQATLDEQGHFVGERYKCKGNYIVGLSACLQGAVREGVITDSGLVDKIERFRNHDFRFHHDEFTSPEEIGMINQILAEVIGYLE